MFHLIYGGTYHRNKVTHWLLGKLITSKTKKKHWPIRLESTGSEASPSNWYFKEGDVPWI